MSMIETLLSSVFAVVGILSGLAFSIVAAPRNFSMAFSFLSLFGKKKKAPANLEEHAYCVLVCAHDEEAVIAGIVDSIANQNYNKDKLKTFVMADNCTDRTAEIAREHGATVFERHNLEKVGKGYALEQLFEELKKDEFASTCKGYFIFDADNIASADFVKNMNETVCEGYELCKGFRASSNFSENLLSMCHGLYFINENETMDRGRVFVKCGTTVTGTGFFVSRRVLELEGGWHLHLFTEDLQLSAHSFVNYGFKVGYNRDAFFYDEQPVDWKASMKQRKRWCFGGKQVFAAYGKDLFRKAIRERSFTALDLFCQLMLSSFFTGFCALLNVISIIVTWIGQGAAAGAASLAIYLGTLYVIFFFMGAVTFIFANRRLPVSAGKKVLLALFYPVYMASFMILSIEVLFAKNVVWEKIAHTGNKDKSVEKIGTN